MCKHSDKNQWLTSFNMHIFKKLQTRNSLRGFVPPSVCWSICQHESGWIPMPTRPQQYLWPRITCWSSFRSVAQFEKKTIQFSTSFFTTLVLMINCASLYSMMHLKNPISRCRVKITEKNRKTVVARENPWKSVVIEIPSHSQLYAYGNRSTCLVTRS